MPDDPTKITDGITDGIPAQARVDEAVYFYAQLVDDEGNTHSYDDLLSDIRYIVQEEIGKAIPVIREGLIRG